MYFYQVQVEVQVQELESYQASRSKSIYRKRNQMNQLLYLFLMNIYRRDSMEAYSPTLMKKKVKDADLPVLDSTSVV